VTVATTFDSRVVEPSTSRKASRSGSPSDEMFDNVQELAYGSSPTLDPSSPQTPIGFITYDASGRASSSGSGELMHYFSSHRPNLNSHSHAPHRAIGPAKRVTFKPSAEWERFSDHGSQ
jgi:hypothetical protein